MEAEAIKKGVPTAKIGALEVRKLISKIKWTKEDQVEELINQIKGSMEQQFSSLVVEVTH